MGSLGLRNRFDKPGQSREQGTGLGARRRDRHGEKAHGAEQRIERKEGQDGALNLTDPGAGAVVPDTDRLRRDD